MEISQKLKLIREIDPILARWINREVQEGVPEHRVYTRLANAVAIVERQS